MYRTGIRGALTGPATALCPSSPVIKDKWLSNRVLDEAK